MEELNVATEYTDTLKQLIAENPDLPIVVAVSDDVKGYYASRISAYVSEILTAETPYGSNSIEDDREEFERQLDEWLYSNFKKVYGYDAKLLTDKEYQEILKEELEKFEPYWIKAIVISAD